MRPPPDFTEAQLKHLDAHEVPQPFRHTCALFGTNWQCLLAGVYNYLILFGHTARLTVDPEKVRLEVWGSSCASVGEMRLHPSMVDPEGWTRLPSTPPEKVIEVTEKAIPGVEVMAHVWQWLQAIDP